MFFYLLFMSRVGSKIYHHGLETFCHSSWIFILKSLDKLISILALMISRPLSNIGHIRSKTNLQDQIFKKNVTFLHKIFIYIGHNEFSRQRYGANLTLLFFFCYVFSFVIFCNEHFILILTSPLTGHGQFLATSSFCEHYLDKHFNNWHSAGFQAQRSTNLNRQNFIEAPLLLHHWQRLRTKITSCVIRFNSN